MGNHFTQNAQDILFTAQDEAVRLGHDYIGPEHLFLAFFHFPESQAMRGLVQFDSGASSWTKELEAGFGPKNLIREGVVLGEIPFSPSAQRVLQISIEEASRIGSTNVGTGHMLLGTIARAEGALLQLLKSKKASLDALRKIVEPLTKSVDEQKAMSVRASQAQPPPLPVTTRFTDNVRHILEWAIRRAWDEKLAHVETEHLLYAIAAVPGGCVASQLLENSGISKDSLRKEINKQAAQTSFECPSCGHSVNEVPKLSSELNQVVIYLPPAVGVARRVSAILDRARQEATLLKREKLGSEHLLLGILGEKGCPAASALVELGVTREKLDQNIKKAYSDKNRKA